MDLPCDGFILLVGDGDFSFTLSLVKKLTLKGSQVTTSNLEDLNSIQQHKLAADNMKALQEMGVQVFLETDARELHTHLIISQVHYQRVIFNFPLVDRHHIKKNRALLADFFSSCSQIVSDIGQVMVTLCKGQGGTPADQPLRSWHDSWQVQAMAANAGFILRDVVSFEASDYPEYHSVGFRFQDKSFNTGGALTHIFVKADVVVCDDDDVSARGTIRSGSISYTCSRYLAEKVNRNLLEEINNPLCLLRQRLEASFILDFGAKAIPEKPDWCILPGHKSRTSVDPARAAFEEIQDTRKPDRLESCDDPLKSIKERKNQANLDTLKNAFAASLMHGVDRPSSDDISETSFNHKDSIVQSCQDSVHLISRFIPENSESVFILIKGNGDSPFCSSKDEDNGGQSEEGDCYENCDHFGDKQNAGCGKNCDHTADEDIQSLSGLVSHVSVDLESYEVNSETQCSHFIPEMKHEIEAKRIAGKEKFQDIGSRVFHCRTSLLENLSELCAHYYRNNCSGLCDNDFRKNLHSSEMSTFRQPLQTSSTKWICGDSKVNRIEPLGLQYDLAEVCDVSLSDSGSIDSQCFMVSGKCFQPGHIVPETIPVRHEMMFVHQICNPKGIPQKTAPSHPTNTSTASPSSLPTNTSTTTPSPTPHPTNASPVTSPTATIFNTNVSLLTNNLNNPQQLDHPSHLQSYNSISEYLISYLKKLEVFSHTILTVQHVNDSVNIILNGFQNVSNINLIFMESNPLTDAAVTQNGGSKVVAGIIFQVASCSNDKIVCILQLDTIACQICNISDPRLLWSRSTRFTNQFQEPPFPQQYQPISLFPMMFAHDLSFWQKDTESEFDAGEMHNIILSVAGDLVCKVNLIDLYTDPKTGLRSRCYRLHFTSHDLVLSYLVSWKLQSLIRMEMALKLGITLR